MLIEFVSGVKPESRIGISGKTASVTLAQSGGGVLRFEGLVLESSVAVGRGGENTLSLRVRCHDGARPALGLRERMALAVLDGDEAAARALADLLADEVSLPEGHVTRHQLEAENAELRRKLAAAEQAALDRKRRDLALRTFGPRLPPQAAGPAGSAGGQGENHT